MQKHLEIEPKITRIIQDLQNAGYETYVVGGAVRDLLLGCNPKDYDISTAATPEQICQVFGRRHTMIIGKRFRLVHYRMGHEIVEISTFRRSPGKAAVKKHPRFANLPEKMIIDDNNFGSSKEDAFRRDFTVNALFYDPVKEEIIDYTGNGLNDIQSKTVRVIGDPDVRFEEDPVRMLRALKLVGRFNFAMDDACENSLFANMEKIGVKTVICTDISKDGAMMGTNLALYKDLKSKYNIDIVASGGVSSMEDIRALKEMDLYGAILGKALYEGAVDLTKAIEVAK